jgi:hypothetical protein
MLVKGLPARILALPLLVMAAFSTPAFAQDKSQRMPGQLIELRAGPSPAVPTLVPSNEDLGIDLPATAKFKVTYTGFTPEAQAAFERAVKIWSTLIDSRVTITIAASFEPLSQNPDPLAEVILGFAGPMFIYRDFNGAKPNFWYGEPLANQLAGGQMDASDPDIGARFNSQVTNWHFGKNKAPAGKFDFTTVALHGIGHGLGFLGSVASIQGPNGTVRFDGSPDIYSRFVENGDGRKILSLPDPSPELSAELQSNDLLLDSKKVRSANRNKPANIYAPNPFEPLISSYSHLDEATFPAGDLNSLMTPRLGQGETIRDPGSIPVAVLKNIGW